MALFNRGIDENRINYIPVTSILPGPYQPRNFYDTVSLNELSDSIKSYGVLQPVTVRLINGRTYELVNGERRWRAAKGAGLVTIPAIIVNVSDSDAAIMALISNLQRQGLNFLEEAEGYNNIILDCALTRDELAEKLGKSSAYIADKLRLLRLNDNMRRLIIENNLSEDYARAFLKIPDSRIQEDILHKTIEDGLSVKKTEELIESLLQTLKGDGSASEAAIKIKFGDMRIINNTVKKTVELIKKSGVKADYTVEEAEDSFKIVINIPFK